jgi:type IV secretory pathway VirJ component
MMARLPCLVAALLLAPPGAWSSPSFAAVAPARHLAEVFNYDRFGAVSIYRGHGPLHAVVLLVSGDGGWDAAMSGIAQSLADQGDLVAGIDFRHYRESLQEAAEACVSPDSDLENLSHYLQSKSAVKEYLEPVLVGAGAGAALVYATLVDAPEGLFKGAISIGFSPDLALRKPLCDNPAMKVQMRLDASGTPQGMTFSAATQMPGKWLVLQGANDPPAAAVRDFVSAVPGAVRVNFADGGTAALDAAVDGAVARVAATHGGSKPAALPTALADLPLIVVPTRDDGAGGVRGAGGTNRGRGQWFGVFLTGDGGWVGLDKGVSLELAKHDIPIVGWDSLKYFWKRRTPDGAAHDLDRVLTYYAHAWGRRHVLLIGYSQGADTMPFMVNRLPAATHALIGYTTLLGISDNALWEFHLATWLGKPPKGIPTQPELEHWSGSPYLCIYGESDADAACAAETGHDGTALKMSGGHHFGGGYDRIADEILSRLPPTSSESESR